MSKQKIVALIGVRGGSKRVPNKNGRPFANSTLIEAKLATLKAVPELDQILVNSDSEELLAIARNCGADTMLRDPAFATDSISTSDYYQHIAEKCDGQIVVSCTVTTPLVKVGSISQGIRAFLNRNPELNDSVTSCSPLKEFLYLDGKPLNYDPENQVRSQDLPNIVSITYGYSVILRQDMIRYRNIVGKRPMFMPISKTEAIDIDTYEDFFIAECLYRELHDNAVVPFVPRKTA